MKKDQDKVSPSFHQDIRWSWENRLKLLFAAEYTSLYNLIGNMWIKYFHRV